MRNSGATIIVEGTGDHAGEYMTGGVVVILGARGTQPRGRHVRRHALSLRSAPAVYDHLSAGVYEIDPLEVEDDERLHELLTRFVDETGSRRAGAILSDWRAERMNFVRIETSEYQRVRDELRSG